MGLAETQFPEHVATAAQAAVDQTNWSGVPPTPSGRRYYERADDILYRADRYPHRDTQALRSMFSSLCERTGMPADTPFYVVAHRDPDRPDLRYFAGFNQRQEDGQIVIAVSDRLLARLSDGQAYALLAHELYHREHPDASPEDRETAADNFSAQMTGHPEWLAQALRIAGQVREEEFTAQFERENPGGRDAANRTLAEAYAARVRENRAGATHDPLEARAARLDQMARDQQQGQGRY